MKQMAYLCVAVMMLNAPVGWATNRNWTNEAGGAFSVNGNWDTAAPGSSDMAVFNLDSATAYTVSAVPNGTANQRVTVAQDKVKMTLSGTYTLSDSSAIVVSTSGTTGSLEIVGGSISLDNKGIQVGGGYVVASGTQHGNLIIDGTTVGVANYMGELGIGNRDPAGTGTGDVIIRGGARFTTSRGIDRIRMCHGSNSILRIEGSGTQVSVGRLNMGVSSSSANNTCIVTNGALFQAGVWECHIGAYGAGRMTVTGTGSELRFQGTAGTIQVGVWGGKGLVEVLNGAYVRDGSSNHGNTYYGAGGSSRGSLLVSGANSRYWVEMDGNSSEYVYFRGNGCTCVVRDGGLINRDLGSKLIFEAGSFLGGDGTLDLPVDMSGTIKPGGSMDNAGWYGVTSGAGIMTIGSTLTLGAGSTCSMELGGKADGEYDRVTVSGDLVLAGTIDVSLISGFTYSDAASTKYTVLETTSGTLSGAFSNAANGDWIATANPEDTFQVHYGPDSIYDPNAVILTPKPMGTVISIQ